MIRRTNKAASTNRNIGIDNARLRGRSPSGSLLRFAHIKYSI